MPRPYMELREWCTLVNKECEWSNCEGCSNNTPKLTKHEENLQECEFVNELTISNTLLTVVNRANTLGKTEISDKLYRFVKYHNLTKTGYSPNNLKQYPLFFMLKKTLRLGIPREIYTANCKTCVAVYDDFAYIIAPNHD